MNLDDKKNILVIGLGKRTGLAVSNFLADRGFSVTVSDMRTEEELAAIIRELDRRVSVVAGRQERDLLDQGFDLLVLSPGVPQKIPLVIEAARAGIPVISEIELAYKYIRGKIVAITGTDGKSTTTSLAGHILKDLGVKTIIGGNIGIPLISLVEATDQETVSVVELSSFQLETIQSFKPDAAAILNVNPDHLDRYENMDEYFKAKLRISMNQGKDDFFVYNREDKMVSSGLEGIRASLQSFSLNSREGDAFYEDGSIFLREGDENIRIIDTERMRIIGVHNIENTMAAILLVKAVITKKGVLSDLKEIEESCYSFNGLPHRMEMIGDFEGRNFINDSKATTVGSVEMALRSLKGRGVLIMGGRTKGDDYSRLAGTIREKVRHLILIGESTARFEKLFSAVPLSKAGDMDDAISRAMEVSEEGDVVLLSPACASFDMFSSFEERGDIFKRSFGKLKSGEINWTSSQ